MLRRRGVVPLGLAVVLTAGSMVGAGEAAPVAHRAPRLLYDDALASVGVPGFAGVWVDPATGDLVVSLTRPTEAAARDARAELVDLLGRPDLAGMRVVARPAQFSFRQLKSWYDDVVGDVLTMPGTVRADIDERANVLRFGVDDVAAATTGITTILRTHRVPDRAVVTERATPATPQLTDEIRPVVGGVQISRRAEGSNVDITCTLGFPAVLGGVEGFVTNSHCTAVEGGNDGTVVNQPVAGKPVGVEVLDPPYVVQPGCPGARPQELSVTLLCRYSDSAFIALLPDVDHNLGTLARPPQDSTTWNGTDTFRITSEGASIVGDSLTKVGRTTGRTSGLVTATCETQREFFRVILTEFGIDEDVYTSRALLCQDRASYLSAGGDSGSPVFATVSGSDDVQLRGIHWGAGGIFSPIAGITRITELGDLTTCAPGNGC